MLLHLPISIVMALSATPVADSAPKFDIVRECRSEGGTQESIDRCVEDEKQALRQVETQWSQFAAKDKLDCTQETTLDGTGSYVELQTCLEMSRDARKAGE